MHKRLGVNHIMVLMDSTASAARAVDYAAILAKALKVKLTALHVTEIETLHQLLSAQVLTADEMVEFEHGLADSAARHLNTARELARAHGVAIETVSVSGNSSVVVPQEVEARSRQMIVLGAFNSSLTRFELLFRQRQHVLDHASCPVLVAR